MAGPSTKIQSNGQRTHELPLIATKLYIPPARADLLSRARLMERLNAGLTRRLTLLSAPAGFGKTTLLSQWRTTGPAKGMPFAWASLDEADNDPARFWAYLIAALQGVQPTIGASLLAALLSAEPPPIQWVLPRLLNELAAIADPFVLVLDDYHAIHNEPVHQSLAFLLGYLPPQMHLVIAGRSDPPLPLSLLRGRGELIELRLREMRFTADEVVSYLNQVLGLGLSEEQIAVLDARTEGWIAGLQMAGLSLQGEADRAAFIAEFSGDERQVLDYLVDQVISRQTEPVQAFLLQTAVLDHLCGPLCDAVTGQPDGQAMLETLEAANLFILPLDHRRRWYRCHPLLADVLRGRLQRSESGRLPELHRRAAGWYEQEGMIYEAVQHLLAAKDFAAAARLAETAIEGDPDTLAAWMKALPAEVIRARPRLCLARARLLQRVTRYDEAEEWLQEAERLLETWQRDGKVSAAEGQYVRLNALMRRALIASGRGEMERIAEIEGQAWALVDKDDEAASVQVAHGIAAAYGECGNIQAQERSLSRVAGSREDARFALQWASLCWSQGRLRQAAEHYVRWLRANENRGAITGGMEARVHAFVAGVHYLWNDLSAALAHLQQAVEIARRWGAVAALEGWVYPFLVITYHALGDDAHAAETMQEFLDLALSTDEFHIGSRAVEAWLWSMLGDWQAASRCVHDLGLSLDDAVDRYEMWTDFSYGALARAAIVQGKARNALGLLAKMRELAASQGRANDLIHIRVVQALAWQALGDTAEALSALQQALTLAKPGGYVRSFVNEGEPMAKLLRLAATRGVAPSYVARLLAAFPASEVSRFQPAQPLVEPLSEREIEVLQLMAAGYSNREMADRLVVSVSTVKTHVHHIYGKLGAGTRTQAVARARELKLVTP